MLTLPWPGPGEVRPFAPLVSYPGRKGLPPVMLQARSVLLFISSFPLPPAFGSLALVGCSHSAQGLGLSTLQGPCWSSLLVQYCCLQHLC